MGEQDVIPQATRTVVEEVPAVAEAQGDILQVLPAAVTLMMIEAHQVEEALPAAVAHQVAEVAPAVVAEREDTKKVENERVSKLLEICLFCFLKENYSYNRNFSWKLSSMIKLDIYFQIPK